MAFLKIYVSTFLALFNINAFMEPTDKCDNMNTIVESFIEEDITIHNYEPNDTYDTATNLNPSNYYELDSYESEINAILDARSQACDYDIYYFSVLTDSYANICVTANTEVFSFDMIIVKHTYQRNTNNELYHNPVNIYENGTAEQTKSWNSLLRPGTYYIVLLNQEPWSSDNIVNYNLKLSVEKQNDYQDASIKDLIYNKKLLGALWMSDYMPIDNNLNFQPQTDIYYQQFSSSLNIPDYTLDSMMYISNHSPVHYATLYIFDPIFRYTIYQIVLSAIESIEEEINGIEEAKVRYEFALDTINKTISVVGYVTSATATILGASMTICLLIPTVELTLESFFHQLFSIITPEVDVNLSTYVSYLKNLLEALRIKELSPDEVNQNNLTYEDIIQYTDDSVICIPFYYELNQSGVGNNTKHTITFHKVMSRDTSNFYVYTDSISCQPTESYYATGKIYGIKELGDLADVGHLKLAEDYDDILYVPQDLYMHSPYAIQRLREGEYIWYNFESTATKEYYFLFKGDVDIKVDVFNQVVFGYTNVGIMDSYSGKYENFYGEDNDGFYFNLRLNEGQKIYLRIHGDAYCSVSQAISILVDDEPFENAIHIHRYSTYIWKNAKKHIARCSCGNSILEGHYVQAGSKVCLLCGGTADWGFVIIDSLDLKLLLMDRNNQSQSFNQTLLVYLDKKEYLLWKEV